MHICFLVHNGLFVQLIYSNLLVICHWFTSTSIYLPQVIDIISTPKFVGSILHKISSKFIGKVILFLTNLYSNNIIYQINRYIIYKQNYKKFNKKNVINIIPLQRAFILRHPEEDTWRTGKWMKSECILPN